MSRLDRFQASNGLKIKSIGNTTDDSILSVIQRNFPVPEPPGTAIFSSASRFLFVQVLEFLIVVITQNPEDCKGFPLKTVFCYAHMPFNTGFTAYTHVQRLLDLKAVLLS
jgi:hypothetical protein